MKKIYAILATAAIGWTGLQAQDRLPLEPFNPDAPSLKEAKGALPSRIAAQAPVDATWENAGTGLWQEGLLDKILPTVVGSSWEVKIEQAKEYPGYYRTLPYATGTPLAEIMQQADDENYVYINATNPGKVYVESFFAFGHIMMANLVPENQWNSYSHYGTLKDGNITFPSNSFAYTTYDLAEYAFCNNSGYFQIALPGNELKDYTLEVDIPACAEDNKMEISVTAGEDIKTVKLMTSYGYFRNSDSNDRTVAERGSTMDLSKGFVTFQLEPEAPFGVYTTIAVGLKEDGSIAASRCAYSHVMEHVDADWQQFGSATFNEAILTTVYSEATQQILTCQVEQSVKQPGRYRLVNPYAEHSWSKAYNDFVIDHGHNHYMYINASNPTMVYIEPAPLGINTDGEAMLYSQAGLYVDAGRSDYAQQQGYFGKLVEDEGELIITMPDGSLMFAESKYEHGAYHGNIGQDFIVVIAPGQVSVNEIEIEDENAPVEYYNLQGIRMNYPRPGQLVIERRGDKVTKKIAK